MTLSDSDLETIIADCGGRPKTEGGEPGLWFGFNPSRPEDTEAATVPHDPAEDVTPLAGDRVLLSRFARIANGGTLPPFNWQLTGSCVHGGYSNANTIRIAVERCLTPTAEVFAQPFCLHQYGYSRYLAFGDTTPGEGSTGDAIARAGKELGKLQWGQPGLTLPAPKVYTSAYCYTKDVEFQYSAWPKVPQAVKDAAKTEQHTIDYVRVTTLDEAEAELRRGRPLTFAGNFGSTMQMGYKGTGANRVLYGPHASRWEHQQCCLGVWRNPELGRIWCILNQWYYVVGGEAVSVHGEPAGDEPPGSYWIDDKSFQSQLSYRFGEVRALKDNRGFDVGKLNHVAV